MLTDKLVAILPGDLWASLAAGTQWDHSEVYTVTCGCGCGRVTDIGAHYVWDVMVRTSRIHGETTAALSIEHYETPDDARDACREVIDTLMQVAAERSWSITLS